MKVHLSTLGYRLERLGLTFKKNTKSSQQAREDLRVRSYAWRETQPMLDPARLVFIDETGRGTARVRR
ncbi:transposase (fragment) [Candidatus Methylobacter favarea]|uniref:Transposase n=1 Tax=Candidatus Methylobacter favarea TaxID=2707345 RepID=A0A8S0Y6J7_9GAMM